MERHHPMTSGVYYTQVPPISGTVVLRWVTRCLVYSNSPSMSCVFVAFSHSKSIGLRLGSAHLHILQK